MEVASEAKVIQIMKTCEKCNEGFMTFTGNVSNRFIGGKPEFVHVCNNCGAIENLPSQYPRMSLIPIEDPRPITDFFPNKEEKKSESTILLT